MCDRAPTWLQYARFPEGSHPPLEPLCPRTVARGILVGGCPPTGYKLMRRVSHSERAPPLDQLNKRNRNLQRGEKRISSRNAGTRRSVMARHHCRSARAFAVNPSRLPARPSGLWGLTAQRGQAKGAAVPSMQNRARANTPLETYEEKDMLIAKKRLDTRGPHTRGCKPRARIIQAIGFMTTQFNANLIRLR